MNIMNLITSRRMKAEYERKKEAHRALMEKNERMGRMFVSSPESNIDSATALVRDLNLSLPKLTKGSHGGWHSEPTELKQNLNLPMNEPRRYFNPRINPILGAARLAEQSFMSVDGTWSSDDQWHNMTGEQNKEEYDKQRMKSIDGELEKHLVF